MTTYREFQAELERLYQQSEKERRTLKAEAYHRIRALVDEYQVPPDMFGLVAWKWRISDDDQSNPRPAGEGSPSASKRVPQVVH